MRIDGTTIAAVCGVITVLVTTVVNPAMAEWRATRLRDWTLERDEALHSHLSSINDEVKTAGETAEAAYHTANNVNEWRQQLTTEMLDKQESTLRQMHEVHEVTRDTNKKVSDAAKRPNTPLIILGTRREEKEDCEE